MKILLFHMRFHPDPTGTAPLVSQLAVDLASAGDEVNVITSLPHYGRSDVHPDYRDRSGLFHVSDYQGVRVWRTPVYVPPRPTVFHRALNYLSYTILAVVAGLRVGKPDVVLAVNPPITAIFSAWVTALIGRSPLVIGIQDIWPDCVILVGQLKNKFLIILSKWMEIFQYKVASKVVVLSEEMKRNLINKNVPSEKIVLIPNWADPDKVIPLPKRNSFRLEHGLDDQFVVLFAGNHGFNAALPVVIDAANLLTSDPDILFLFVGEGNVKSDIVAKSKNAGLDNVRFLPTQPEENLSQVLASADIGLVPLRKTLGDLSVPSKVYTLMAAARPILAAVPENSGIVSLLEEAGCGIFIPAEDPEALAEALINARSIKQKLEKMGNSGRVYLEKNYARHAQTERYIRLLHGFVPNKVD